MNEIIIFENQEVKLEVNLKDETVWLNRKQISKLFDKDMLINETLLPVGTVYDTATDLVIENNEIVLKGDSVFSGYLNGYIGGYYQENGIDCYRTGDLGYIKDGKIYCCGRMDRQIKYKGYRIELDDIESNIYNINGVKDCAVIAKYEENGLVKMIKAFVVLNDNLDENYINMELKKRLPLYMIPKVIKKLDKMPVNKNGKIDRKLLIDL